MPRLALEFGSPLNNDGEKLKSAFSKIDVMTDEIYTLIGLAQPKTPFLTSLLGVSSAGLLARASDGTAAVQTLGTTGQALVAAASAQAARDVLQLGAAALLGTSGAGSVVVRDANGQLPYDSVPKTAWADIPGKPSVFPPASHTTPWTEVTSVPALIQALAGLASQGLVTRTAVGLDVTPSSALGLSLLGAVDAPAARGLLNLGAAALLGTAGAGSVVTRGADGTIAPGDLPAIALNDTFEAGSQAAMLALTAQKGDACVRTDLSKTFLLAADPASVLANWKEVLAPVGSIASVFGLTSSAVSILGLTGLAGSVEDADALPIYDASAGAHARVTRAALLSMLAAPDGKTGLTDGSASLMVANSAGALSKVALSDWIGAHAANSGPLDTDSLLIGPLAGLPKRTTLAQLFNGRTLQNSRLIGVTETKQARTDISGAVTMGTYQVGNTYHYRLTGNATLTPPTRPTATNGAVGITVIVEQDGTGGRTFGITPASGETILWSGGSAGTINPAPNSITVFSLMSWQGATVWLASKWI